MPSTTYFLDGYPKLVREYRVKFGIWDAKKFAAKDIMLAALNSAQSWEDVRDCMKFQLGEYNVRPESQVLRSS